MQSFADSIADHIKRTKNLIGVPLLDAVRERVEKEFPAKFDNPARHGAPAVGESGGNPTGGNRGGGKRTFDNLPNEAKITCNNWVRNGLGTREEYLKSYDWS